MKILIDIGHPAHIHYLKNTAKILISKGHIVLFTTRDKEVTIKLLDYYNFEYVNFGKPFKGTIGKIKGLGIFNYKLFKTARTFKPDIILSAGSIYASHVSWLLRKPHITLEDTYNMEQMRLYLPFTDAVLTGDYEHPSLGKREIKYTGYQELAYMHPKYFKPDKTVLKELGVDDTDKFVILRFVSWSATHDKGHKGISVENKIKAVREFEKYARVFISSESVLPYELEKYRIRIHPSRMHDALAFVSLLFGESATMASECAMLGVPSIFFNNNSIYYLVDEEKYGLVFNYSETLTDQEKAINRGVEILNISGIKEDWQKRKQEMLKNKIDVTAFLVWFVENYPESFRIMKVNPDYQYNFK
jgi:predicted glycosyltransferase